LQLDLKLACTLLALHQIPKASLAPMQFTALVLSQFLLLGEKNAVPTSVTVLPAKKKCRQKML
jgi:hypothetical protein